VFLRSIWLKQLGHALVLPAERNAPLPPAEVVLLPNADYLEPEMGRPRLEQAALIVRKHLAGSVLMACPDYYGVSVCDLASDALREWGYPEVPIKPLRLAGLPDTDEARVILSHCRQVGIRVAFVLLPSYKSRRLSRTYATLAREFGLKIAVLAASDTFDPDSWWHSRESQKLFFREAVKWVGLP
jgi:hypothetical protein